MDIELERLSHRYRSIWAILRNQEGNVNQKTFRKVLNDNNLNLPASIHRGRTKTRNLFKPIGPNQLWEIDITYIPTESGMTYLMWIKDYFTKEWQGYHYSRSFVAKETIRSLENSVLMEFYDSPPEGIVFRTDNGPLYTSHEFVTAIKLLGIKLE